MSRAVLPLLLATALPLGLLAQRPAEALFPRRDLMSMGAYYYPEQWPKSQWERDLKRMAAMGFNFTHFAEFAWGFLEPEEGRFDFRWLDEALDLAAKAGLKVILCTPTAAPPAWMGEKYPEIYLTGANGLRREHGARGNGCLTNPRFNASVDRVLEALAQRYGKDPRVWGWQVDNEPDAPLDYSPSARTAFQAWLKARYGTVEALNQAWGAQFWSIQVDRFEQVLLPNPARTGGYGENPHALLDFMRFTSDTQAAHLDRQAAILKKHARPGQWVTTNYTNVTNLADPRRTKALDFATYTMYPVRGQNEMGGQSFRHGAPFRMAEANDFFRPIGGVTGVMELQPGQVNWAATNPQPQPGAVNMWIWHAFGGGCSFVCTYRFRQPLFGAEMYHDGILGPDGLTPTRGGREFAQAIADLKRLRAVYDPKAALPTRVAARRTAFLWNHEALWDLNLQKQSAAWDTWRHRNAYTAAVKSTGAPMDFIAETDDFSAYPVLVAPAYHLVDPALVAKWKAYAEGGGHLVLTCRTGVKDKRGHLWEAPWAAPVMELAGAELTSFDMLLPADKAHVRSGARTFTWNAWGDVLKAKPGTEILATHTDQFYAGEAAALRRPLGKGSVTYIGVSTQEGDLERELVRQVYRRAGIAIEDLPKGVFLEWRDGFFVGVNYGLDPATLPVPQGAKVLVGANPLQPATALVWKE